MNQLDAFDRAILGSLQEDATLSYAELGQRVNLSASAALRRVQRMRDDRTIVATRTIVDPTRIGCPLTIIVEVALENERTTTLDGIKQALIDDPHVQQCYYVTGDADLFVVLAVPAMVDFKLFTERHLLGNPQVKRFKTTVVLDNVKSTSVYPL